MGAGKSTAGKKLAHKLKLPFFDFDDELKNHYGATPAEILEKEGEDEFRRKETGLLRAIVENHQKFVGATGGGLPCFHGNMDVMKREGVTVYLKLHPISLYKRLSNSRFERPLLRGLSGDKLLNRISSQLKEREVYYEQADVIIKGESIDIYSLMDEVLKVAETKASGNKL